MSKESCWQGYYDGYRSKAAKRGITAVEVLDEEWHHGRDAAKHVLPYLSAESQVLEIACGLGRVSRFVAPHCRHLTCTDILEEALAEARQNLAACDNVSLHKTNGYDLLEFTAERFDCVYSFTTFFHFDFELVVHYFGEIQRVLKPGGTAIIEFKPCTQPRHLHQLLDKIDRCGGIVGYEAHLSKWRYVSREMLELLCNHYELEVVTPNVTTFTFRK